MDAPSTSVTDPGIIQLYQSISTILRNRNKSVSKDNTMVISKPYFTKEEHGGLYQFRGLNHPVPFLTNLIQPADTWTSANSSPRFLNDRVEAVLRDVSQPIIERCKDKWGAMIKSMDIGYRMSAPFHVKFNGVDYSFSCDAVLWGINFSQGNQNRLVEVFLQEASKEHPRRGLCQIQRANGKELVIEAAFCVYPGYTYTRVFALRDKTYFTHVESSLV